VETEFAGGLGGRTDELADGVEDDAELDEGPHDGDVHLHGALGAQHARKQGDALLSEGVGEVPATSVLSRSSRFEFQRSRRGT
jgi:hypothetical protein